MVICVVLVMMSNFFHLLCIQVSVTTESKLKQANELKEFIRTYGADKIRDLLRSYVTKLKHGTQICARLQ